MSLMYRPSGRALEYAPLACNPYTGCIHDCAYCYIRGLGMDTLRPKERNLSGLEAEAKSGSEEVFFSFACDPLIGSHGIDAMNLVRKYRPIKVLSKRGDEPGTPYGPDVTHGTTLTTLAGELEPHAATLQARIDRIRKARAAGGLGFLSLEPLLSEDAIAIVTELGPEFDFVNVGWVSRFKEPRKSLVRDVILAAQKTCKSVGIKYDAWRVAGEDFGCVRLWETEGSHGIRVSATR